MALPGNSPPTRGRKKTLRKFMRSILQGRIATAMLSRLAIGYLSLVRRTNTFVVEPPDALDIVTPEQPFIVGVWHGQHILLPVLPIGLQANAMISRNFDGEVTARIVEHFGNGTIRASGGRVANATLQKGGISGFLEMLHALDRKENVVQTADIPKGISRRAGLGIVQLARKSGTPIIPLAIASSRRIVFDKAWDKAALNLPFGTTAICIGELIRVSPDADDDEIEKARAKLEHELNVATSRAYQLTGKPE